MADTSLGGFSVRNWLQQCMRINKELVLLKAHFFFFLAALACVIPSLILYCQQLGASVSMVGVLFAVLPFVQCVVKPITGGIADKFQIPKLVFMVSIVMLTVSCFSINFIPEVDPDGRSNASGLQASGRISCLPSGGNLTLELCDVNATVGNNGSLSQVLGVLPDCNLTCGVPELLQFNGSRCSTPNENCSEIHYNLVMSSAPIVDKVHLGISREKSVELLAQNHTDMAGLLPKCRRVAIANVTSVGSGQVLWTSSASSIDLCQEASNLELACRAQCPVAKGGSGSGSAAENSTVFQFVWLWIACIIMWCSFGTMLSTSDAILLNVLGDDRDQYGKTRLYSSVGWGLLSVIAGQLIDWSSGDSPKKDYSPGFYLFLAFMVCDFLLAIRMKVEVTESPKNLAKDILRLFGNLEFTLFTLAVYFTGMTTGVMWTFVVVYAFQLNGSQLIIGLNYAVECFLSEIPFFLASGLIVQKFGHVYSMCFVLVLTGFKCLCYYFIDNAWYILIIALIHGANYGVFYSTAATYASIVAPPGASTTIQGLFQGIFEGAGVGSGSLIGGIIYEHYGGSMTFLVFGVATMVVGCLYWLISFIRNKQLHRSQTVATDKTSNLKLPDKNENNQMPLNSFKSGL